MGGMSGFNPYMVGQSMAAPMQPQPLQQPMQPNQLLGAQMPATPAAIKPALSKEQADKLADALLKHMNNGGGADAVANALG